ncbi:MAG TPA: hypothetical protein VLT36_02540 [Candidatus Dormibacteraeota bacterium]|nr:hypothetical protein [Candidatus Dormibacteraeota bacterium]
MPRTRDGLGAQMARATLKPICCDLWSKLSQAIGAHPYAGIGVIGKGDGPEWRKTDEPEVFPIARLALAPRLLWAISSSSLRDLRSHRRHEISAPGF